jgi:hypothetical protein
VIWDVGTSAIIHAEVTLARRLGQLLPAGVAFDSDGQPTRDPAAALAGAFAAWGGHKGSGLGIVVQLLGIMAGSPPIPPDLAGFGHGGDKPRFAGTGGGVSRQRLCPRASGANRSAGRWRRHGAYAVRSLAARSQAPDRLRLHRRPRLVVRAAELHRRIQVRRNSVIATTLTGAPESFSFQRLGGNCVASLHQLQFGRSLTVGATKTLKFHNIRLAQQSAFGAKRTFA